MIDNHDLDIDQNNCDNHFVHNHAALHDRMMKWKTVTCHHHWMVRSVVMVAETTQFSCVVIMKRVSHGVSVSSAPVLIEDCFCL